MSTGQAAPQAPRACPLWANKAAPGPRASPCRPTWEGAPCLLTEWGQPCQHVLSGAWAWAGCFTPASQEREINEISMTRTLGEGGPLVAT